MKSKAPAATPPPGVARAKEFVLANVSEEVALPQVAAHARLSPPYFCKVFKRATGMTLTEFKARARVQRAKTLLGDQALRVNEVADRAGFKSISQFNRVFRRYAGQSPTDFRAALRESSLAT